MTAAATFIGADLGWRATNVLRHDLAEHLISLDMSYHTSTTPGEMIERVAAFQAVGPFETLGVVNEDGRAALAMNVSRFSDHAAQEAPEIGRRRAMQRLIFRPTQRRFRRGDAKDAQPDRQRTNARTVASFVAACIDNRIRDRGARLHPCRIQSAGAKRRQAGLFEVAASDAAIGVSIPSKRPEYIVNRRTAGNRPFVLTGIKIIGVARNIFVVQASPVAVIPIQRDHCVYSSR